MFVPAKLVVTTPLRSGNLLLSRSGTIGRSLLYDEGVHGPCSFAGYLVRFRPLAWTVPKFLFYFTKSLSFFDQIGEASVQTTIENFNAQRYASLVVPVPSAVEQRAIADFLDRKTAAIDALIEKKEQSVRLLVEKRHAVLTRAVTRGIQDQALTRPTNSPWFPAIPAHWQLVRLKYCSPHVTVGIVVTPARYYVDSGVPVLRSFNILPGEISDSDLAFISPASNILHTKSILTKDDLVAVRTGKPGTTAVVDDRFHGANCVDLIIVRRSSRLSSQFLCTFMNSGPARQQFGEGAEGALQQHFNVETAGNLVVPVPPLAEQNQIMAWLNKELARANRAVDLELRQTTLLREYRQALITAAVTGQLDVSKEEA